MDNQLTNIEQAKVYIGMADKIQLGRFKEKYYKLALEAIRKAEEAAGESQAAGEKPAVPAVEELKKEIEALKKEASHKLNEARASMVIEKYDFACKSREYAKTSEDQGSAALHFRDAEEARKTISVDPEDLSPEIRAAYEEVKESAEAAKVCEKKATVTYQSGRIKLLAGLAVIIILVAGIWTGRETVTFNTGLANVLSLIGMKTTAADFYEKAYNRHADETTYTNYIKGLYEAGVKENKHGNSEEAAEYLHLPALEGYEDAAEICTEAELSLMKDSEVGDEVTFAGVSWYVLESEDESLTLLKKDGIDAGAFNSNPANGSTWAESDLREFLNTNYMTDSFNIEEQKILLTTTVMAEDNALFGTDGGENTEDLVYILSASEVEAYGDLVNHCGHLTWLRTPGALEGTMTFVNVDESIMDYGYDETADSLYCKPVIRIKVENRP